MEWFFIAGLAIIVITEFFIMAGGIINMTPQTSMMNMSLLMIIGGELLLGILMLRIIELLGGRKK